ncbi:MAG TPA: hypothetical protein VF691_14565, partial [Cytophagaceae bacterium]
GIFSCQNQKTESVSTNEDTLKVESEATNIDTAGRLTKGGLTLTPVTNSPDFPDAILELNSPEEKAKLKNNVVEFSYEIKNFELKGQTADAAHKDCANSKQGQHIHLILNNAPYKAKYETKFSDTLQEGHYIALSFLSRSYHESLKHREAYDLRQFTVGKAAAAPVDLTKPLLFYSRPKGEYKGAEIKKVLLDFYLVNTTLAADSNKVKATINGNEFLIDKWQPYAIEGLQPGEATIKLELIDKSGKTIEGPFNTVERKITLKEEATQ